MNDLVKNYIEEILEYNKQEKRDEMLFEEIFGDDIISISDDMEAQYMEKSTIKEIELLTIISLIDNPNLKLSVAQPSKYKVERTKFGIGIMCYKANALQMLKKQLKSNEKIIKIKIQVSAKDILDLTSSDKKYLKDVYNTITDKEAIKTDADFIDYVCKNGVRNYSVVSGFYPLGNQLYEGSIIVDYMDRIYLIRNRDIIISAKDI